MPEEQHHQVAYEPSMGTLIAYVVMGIADLFFIIFLISECTCK